MLSTPVAFAASAALVVVASFALVLFRLGLALPFAAVAGGLGIMSGLLIAASTSWGVAPPIACALCGLGAGFLGATVTRFSTVAKEASIDAKEEDEIAHKALSGLFVSSLRSIGILAVATVVITLIALNFDLGHLDVTGLTLISIIAIVGATVVILAIRSWPEKT